MSMSRIRTFFRSISDNVKSQFKKSRCLLTISVGQATHEGELFAATMDLINTSFESCIILIDDSLQRHTMAFNKAEDASFFYEKSIKEGQFWLTRNNIYYDKLTIPKKIIHWDMWLNHVNYKAQQKSIISLLESDPLYKAAFDQSIDEFLVKYCARLPEPDKFSIEIARQLSFDFVLEECTALCLWPELECHFECYPNKHNAAIEQTRKRFIFPSYPHLLQSVTMGFKNAPQLQPQNFELFRQEDKITME